MLMKAGGAVLAQHLLPVPPRCNQGHLLLAEYILLIVLVFFSVSFFKAFLTVRAWLSNNNEKTWTWSVWCPLTLRLGLHFKAEV